MNNTQATSGRSSGSSSHPRPRTVTRSVARPVTRAEALELRAIGGPHAPWVHALAETRALLFVALRELIVGPHEAELSMHLPQEEHAHKQ